MSDVMGICCICGQYKKLSFEHLPPRKAFNDQPVVLARFEELIGKNPSDSIKGKAEQKGAGAYTICNKCNNDTGSWYGRSYISWVRQGMTLGDKSHGEPTLLYLFRIYPLRVIKQIMTMFFSANGQNFQAVNPNLVKFVLNKKKKYLEPKFKIYAAYNFSTTARQSGIVGRVADKGKRHLLSEFSFPPFTYVLTIDSMLHDKRLQDISYFANFDYDQQAVVWLELAVLPIYSYVPGDYRSKEEIDKISKA